jgi:hypothetical protein
MMSQKVVYLHRLPVPASMVNVMSIQPQGLPLRCGRYPGPYARARPYTGGRR